MQLRDTHIQKIIFFCPIKTLKHSTSAPYAYTVFDVATSNHLTGCAADIRVLGNEQLVRYATILLDISDESGEDFDELIFEHNSRTGNYWLHFAVRPNNNRRKIKFINK